MIKFAENYPALVIHGFFNGGDEILHNGDLISIRDKSGREQAFKFSNTTLPLAGICVMIYPSFNDYADPGARIGLVHNGLVILQLKEKVKVMQTLYADRQTNEVVTRKTPHKVGIAMSNSDEQLYTKILLEIENEET